MIKNFTPAGLPLTARLRRRNPDGSGTDELLMVVGWVDVKGDITPVCVNPGRPSRPRVVTEPLVYVSPTVITEDANG